MNLSVTNSPFNEEQATQLNQIIQNLTPEQQTWLSGYLTANQQAVANGSAPTPQVAEYVLNNEPQANSDRHITILYGSETGNAQGLGEIFADRLVEHNYTVKLSSMDDFKPKDLKKVEDLFVISSTHGEGDPPDNALSFHEFLHGRKAPKLEGVRFSVLALGDESYEFFCQTGKDFDKRLEELGGERIIDRQDCDIDYDDLAEKWMNANIEKLNSSSGIQQQTVTSTETVASAKEKRYSKVNPYRAEVLENINLNGRGSNKEVRHVELLLDNYGEEYEPGDCLVVIPENDPEIVTLLIDTLKFDETEEIAINEDGDTLPLRKALTEHFEITKLTKPLLQKAADLIGNTQLSEKVQDADWVHTYIDGRDLVDLFTDFPSETFKAENLHQLLRKLPPREYSIASSYKANPDEVHITVGAVRYHAHGRDRSGVCSVQLAERVQPGDTIPIYLKKNPNFKFPTDETPVIMIGPGTGVAPFRAYMQEREELGLESKTWLFFGEQHFTTDFLYQTEWQEWLKDDVLTKLDLAFSRDTDEKVYVQHRIAEHSATFYEWLMNGAALYVCGDEKQMAKDVHQTIRYVLEQEGGMSETEAEAYLTEMKKEKRYQRDVY